MSGEQLDVIVGGIQQDPGRIHILGRQLEDLIAEKGPDLHVLCNTLREEKLVSKEECRELHAILAVDAVSTLSRLRDRGLMRLFPPRTRSPGDP